MALFSNKLVMGAALVTTALMFAACGEKEFYTDEQYRKECYIVSGDDNIFGQEFTFGNDSTGNLSIYISGSRPVDHDVTVTLRENKQYLLDYNTRIYGSTYASYVELLPDDKFTLPQGWSVTVTPENPYTLFPITVDIDGLQPDLQYMLPLEIASVSDYQYNEDRNYVLLRIYMKNEYATTKSDTYYQMNGSTLDVLQTDTGWVNNSETGTAIAFNATKKITPIDRNAIRMLPGTSTGDDIDVINRNSVRINVTDEDIQVPILGDDGLPTGQYNTCKRVTIEPYMEGHQNILVYEATDGDDPTQGEPLQNYYDAKTKTFTVNYCYHLSTESANRWHKVKEIMTRLDL